MATSLMPQDLLICLKLAVNREYDWTVADLAAELALSASQVHYGVRRARAAGLMSTRAREPILPAVEEFALHGARYAFPAELGAAARGVPTAASAEPLLGEMASQHGDRFVWPHPEGSARGTSVSPLHPAAPAAVLVDPRLHECLALLDGIRLGPARLREVSGRLLAQRLR